MENDVIIQGKFIKNKRGAIGFAIFGFIWILDGILVPLIVIPAIVASVFCFYYAWFFANSDKQILTVTPHRVYIKLKQQTKEIPIDKISSIEKRGPYTMKIKSSSGTVNITFCTNRDEVANAITDLMNNKKANKDIESIATSLRMYQELVKEGTITQEEFEAKKKQLLGL